MKAAFAQEMKGAKKTRSKEIDGRLVRNEIIRTCSGLGTFKLKIEGSAAIRISGSLEYVRI
jgi:hypothetical protein